MPKKRHLALYSKPPSTVHHSPSSTASTASNAAASSRSDDSLTVTELLTSLRASQASADGPRSLPVIAPSMPAEIRQLLDLPDTPTPRPRTMRRVDPFGRRLPAGPAPPRSWLIPSRDIIGKKRISENETTRSRGGIDRLPGVTQLPTKTSLMATCLRQMAKDWIIQCDYNCDYLATLPTKVRSILLSYIASYGPEEGVGYEGLKAILRPGEDIGNEFTGNDDFERLDLAGAVGRSISFKQLQELLAPTRTKEEDEESWDETNLTILPSMNTAISSLKTLSIADPPKTVSWAKFLAFATTVPTVTHLSLANWPTPSLTPNSITATMSSRYLGNLQYGGTNYYSHILDHDWSEAASILRRLSNALYSLEWLDVDGCDEWFAALRWGAPEAPGIDWKERWGKVRNLSLLVGFTLPVEEMARKDIVRYKTAILNAMELEKQIRRLRGWVVVECDEWTRYDSCPQYEGWDKGRLERDYKQVKMGRESLGTMVASAPFGSTSNVDGYWDFDGHEGSPT